MVKHHAIFSYYFFEYLGLDKNMRETYKDHPMYEQTLEFIEKYDAPAFDPKQRPSTVVLRAYDSACSKSSVSIQVRDFYSLSRLIDILRYQRELEPLSYLTKSSLQPSAQHTAKTLMKFDLLTGQRRLRSGIGV